MYNGVVVVRTEGCLRSNSEWRTLDGRSMLSLPRTCAMRPPKSLGAAELSQGSTCPPCCFSISRQSRRGRYFLA